MERSRSSTLLPKQKHWREDSVTLIIIALVRLVQLFLFGPDFMFGFINPLYWAPSLFILMEVFILIILAFSISQPKGATLTIIALISLITLEMWTFVRLLMGYIDFYLDIFGLVRPWLYLFILLKYWRNGDGFLYKLLLKFLPLSIVILSMIIFLADSWLPFAPVLIVLYFEFMLIVGLEVPKRKEHALITKEDKSGPFVMLTVTMVLIALFFMIAGIATGLMTGYKDFFGEYHSLPGTTGTRDWMFLAGLAVLVLSPGPTLLSSLLKKKT